MAHKLLGFSIWVREREIGTWWARNRAFFVGPKNMITDTYKDHNLLFCRMLHCAIPRGTKWRVRHYFSKLALGPTRWHSEQILENCPELKLLTRLFWINYQNPNKVMKLA